MIKLLQKYKYQKARGSNGELLLSDTSGTKLATGLGLDITTPSRVLRTREDRLPDILLNWGTTDLSIAPSTQVYFNSPNCVRVSSNKLDCFIAIANFFIGLGNYSPPIPTGFHNIEAAREWLRVHPTDKIFCRTLLNSSSGKGIVVARTPEELVSAPLYTVYFPKKWEIRVHIGFGKVIHVTQKRRLSTEQLELRGIDSREKLIRNLDNGYIFSNNLDSELGRVLDDIISDCTNIVKDALSLDFGAVDVVINQGLEYKILEVNSAPGLEGNTLEKYISFFEEILEDF